MSRWRPEGFTGRHFFASTGRKRYNPNMRDNLKLYIFLSSMIENPETNPVSGTMKVS